MNDEFDTVAFALPRVWVADDPENPATFYCNGGQGLADDSGKEPEIVACYCTTETRIGDYYFVWGENASGEPLYRRRLQCVRADAHRQQYFKRQN
jgi:hypothetical protein